MQTGVPTRDPKTSAHLFLQVVFRTKDCSAPLGLGKVLPCDPERRSCGSTELAEVLACPGWLVFGPLALPAS